MSDAPRAARTVDPHLTAYLAERDEPCPACRYNLRGLLSDRCPECSEPLTLRLSLVDPKLGLWVAALVLLSLGGGFCAIVSVWGAFEGEFADIVPVIIGTALIGGAIMCLIVLRRRFVRLTFASRIALTILGAALPSVFIAWFFGTI